MKSQRKAREVALQILFQKGFQETKSARDLFNSFADNFTFDDDTKEYALVLTEGVIQNEENLNHQIESFSENWKLDRIAVIDKIILQLAIFELTTLENAPTAPKLAITDFIDLAKKYSSEDSKNFINGILDRIYNQFGDSGH